MRKLISFRLAVQSGAVILLGTALFTGSDSLKLVLLGMTFLGGAFYCGWLCPLGFLQDFSALIGRKLGIKKRQIPRNLDQVLIYTRYILAVAILLWTADVLFTVVSYEPRGTILGILGGTAPSLTLMGVLVFFLMISVFYERLFCRYFCIEGAKLGALSLFRLLTVHRNPRVCVTCGKCDKACPVQIQVSKTVNLRSPQCVNCMECVSACPVKGALAYRIVGRTCSSKRDLESVVVEPSENHKSA